MNSAFEKEKIKELREAIISGNYCHEGNPFQSIDQNEVIFEEFCLWKEEYYLKLQKILEQNAQQHFYALEYQSDERTGIKFIKLHKVDAALDYEAYTQAGFDIGFTINGLEFYIFDDTLAWCIGTTTDVQFITGDKDTMDICFESDQKKRAISEAFIKEFDRPEMSSGYRKMKNYIKLRDL